MLVITFGVLILLEQNDIEPKTLAKIASLYPNDKARYYGQNEIRGIWVVEMDKK